MQVNFGKAENTLSAFGIKKYFFLKTFLVFLKVHQNEPYFYTFVKSFSHIYVKVLIEKFMQIHKCFTTDVIK